MKTVLIIVGVIFFLGFILWIIDIIKEINLKIQKYKMYPHLRHLPDDYPYVNNEVKCIIFDYDNKNTEEDLYNIDNYKESTIMVKHNTLYLGGEKMVVNMRYKKTTNEDNEDKYWSGCDHTWCMSFSKTSVGLYYPLVKKEHGVLITFDDYKEVIKEIKAHHLLAELANLKENSYSYAKNID